jgi:uncharacterized protein (DUF4415 family)
MQKPNPELIDDENPEWTEEDFKKAVPFSAFVETLPETLRANFRGRPRLAAPKKSITLRVDADLVSALKAGGRGWQTRLNAHLRDWLMHAPPPDLER